MIFCMSSMPIRTRLGIVESLELEHWLYAEFDSPVVLLRDIIQVLTTANLYRIVPAAIEFIAHAHPAQCRVTRFEAVECDRSRLAVMLD